MTTRAFCSHPLVSQKAGWWDPHEPREPYPPAPMALACAETQQAEQARAALVAAENARLSAVQTSAETEDALPPRSRARGHLSVLHRPPLHRDHPPFRPVAGALGHADGLDGGEAEPPLEPDLWVVIVDYLAAAFPARRSNPRARNPFLIE